MENQAENTKKVLGIKQVLENLKNGMTREDIGEHYGLKATEVKVLFQHPSLKHKKTIKPVEVSFVLVEDTEEIESNDVLKEVGSMESNDVAAEESEVIENKNEAEVANALPETKNVILEDNKEVEEEVAAEEEAPKNLWE